MKNFQKHLLTVIVVSTFCILAIASGDDKKSSKKLAPDEAICLNDYKRFKKANGWCYDVGGIGTQNCSGGKNFCSYSCASSRGKENTPKSWQKQYN